MEILYLMLPIAVLVAIVLAVFFIWSVRSGQYDDLEGPAHRILMDEDDLDPAEDDTREHHS